MASVRTDTAVHLLERCDFCVVEYQGDLTRNRNAQVREIKNGRLAMIAISGMTHHYFLTGKGPIEFITQIPNFRSCTLAAVQTGLCR